MGGKLEGPGKRSEVKEIEEKVTKSSFDIYSTIGKGGFGRVVKVYSRKHKKFFALKEMSKAKIIDKRSEKSVKYERDLLSRMNHPFIVNMHYAFQDTDYLYIVMDLLTGGDLRYHLCKYKKFNEEQTQFFMACMILGLEYLHTNNIIHRDIKPENLVLDSRGYVKMTDFGIAKLHQKENSHETSGTPGYMAPEVMCSQNHTLAVDYFALGVIGYEFMNGTRPYVGKTRKEIKEKLMNKQAQVKKTEIPKDWSIESADCINRLLQRKPAARLGLRGAAEVKEHSWFKYYSWKDLYLNRIESPFIPPQGDNYDQKYCSKQENLGLSTQERYIGIIGSNTYHSAFKEFAYFNRAVHEKLIQNQIGVSKDFVNPHLVYFEEITGNNNNDNDASVINRNILLKTPAQQEDLYSDLKKYSGQAQPSLFKMYNSYRKHNRSINCNLSKGNSNASFRNIDNSMSNSIYTSKKHSYCKGNSYNF